MEDNQATIKLGRNKMASARSKHIDTRHHVIRYHNDKGTIELKYIESSDVIQDDRRYAEFVIVYVRFNKNNHPRGGFLCTELGIHMVDVNVSKDICPYMAYLLWNMLFF